MTREDYLRRAEFALRDLRWKLRRELVSELRVHLDELPDGTDLGARLGTPEEYVAEMRSAAGLERRRGATAFLLARRPRNVVLAALALTLTGLVIGAVAWVDSYEPIVFAGGTQQPPDSRPSSGQAGVTVVFRKGRPFEYGITIHNDDRFSVRVLGVPRDATDFFSGRLMMSVETAGNMDERPLEPFHPFDLQPGSFRWLLFKGVYACTTGAGVGTGITWEDFPIEYSFLWRTATVRIPLHDPLTITFPKSCPPGGS